MATSTSFLEERLDAGALPAAVGDMLTIPLLVTVGAIQHNGVSYLLADPVGRVLTAAPFLIGWLFTAPLLGAYSPGAAESARSVVPLDTHSWLATAVVGTAVHWTPFSEGGVELTLVVVMLVLGPVAPDVWRTSYFKFA